MIIFENRKKWVGLIIGIFFPCICLIFLCLNQIQAKELTVRINEVCSNNFSTAPLSGRENSDWIELYNAGEQEVDLSGWSVSDGSEKKDQYILENISLKPGEYLLLYATGEDCVTEEGIFLNFRLSQEEGISLSDKEGKIVDSVALPKTTQNTSYARSEADGKWKNSMPTPGQYNEEIYFIEDVFVAAPQFSVEGGFYSEDVYLELTAEENCDIYYTIDGSEPTTESMWYIEPLLLTSRSGEENVFSARNDFSTGEEYADVPAEPVDKINVIRAIAVDAEGNCSEIVTNSYLIGLEDSSTYQNIMTVSLTSDPEHWFDNDTGLYIRGSEYDDFMAELEAVDLDKDDVDNEPELNYNIEGKTSERAGYIEIFNADRECILEQAVGLRVHGHYTRILSQKSFSVYAREMYSGKDYFETDVFGKDRKYSKFMIYNDRDETKARQKLFAELLKDRDVATPEFAYCNIFLDGEYWGLYLLTEDFNEEYIETHYGVKEENVVLHEGIWPDELREIAKNEEGLEQDEVIEQLLAKMDLESYLDYYASMIYIENWDWLPHNGYAWKSSTISKDNPYEDGKWRWMVYDTELCARKPEENTFLEGNVVSTRDDRVFNALMQDEQIRQQFIDTMNEMADTVFSEANVLQTLEWIESERVQAISAQAQRWGGYWSEEKVSAEMEKVRNFFINRKAYILEYMEQEFETILSQS